MEKFAILASLKARPGKEAEVEAFLKSAQPLVAQEAGTTSGTPSRSVRHPSVSSTLLSTKRVEPRIGSSQK